MTASLEFLTAGSHVIQHVVLVQHDPYLLTCDDVETKGAELVLYITNGFTHSQSPSSCA